MPLQTGRDYRGYRRTLFPVREIINLISKHATYLRLDYSAGPGIEPRTVYMYVQSPEANSHRLRAN